VPIVNKEYPIIAMKEDKVRIGFYCNKFNLTVDATAGKVSYYSPHKLDK